MIEFLDDYSFQITFIGAVLAAIFFLTLPFLISIWDRIDKKKKL